jgi:O-methyltransferase / aklanonic acid methyltransferase
MDEAEVHKDWVAGVFDRAAQTYDRVGEPYHDYFGRRLVEVLEPRATDAVLDVGCGRGAVLVPASGRVGRLVGIDTSPGMLTQARRELERVGAAGVDLHVMDAEALTFADATFDAVTCAFTLFFLPRPERAAAEFARVVRPGGRVIVSTWGQPDPRWAFGDDLLASLPVARRAVRRPLEDPEEVRDLLAGAGLTDVTSRREDHEIRFTSVEEWWSWQWSFSLRGMLEQLDGPAVEALREASQRAVPASLRAEGLPMRLCAWFTTATASEAAAPDR